MLLVGFRRIYFDAETKQATEVELPLFGKIKTQTPAILLILIGAFLVAYPLTRSRPDMATLVGNVDPGLNSVIVRVVAPQFQTVLQGPGPYHFPVPVLKDTVYRVEFIVDKKIVSEQDITLDHNEFRTAYWSSQGSPTANTITRKDTTDEVLEKAGIPVAH